MGRTGQELECVEAALLEAYKPSVDAKGKVKRSVGLTVFSDYDEAEFTIRFLGEKFIRFKSFRRGENRDSRLKILVRRFARRRIAGRTLAEIERAVKRDRFASEARDATVHFERHAIAPDGDPSLVAWLDRRAASLGGTDPVAYEVAQHWENELGGT